MSKKKNIVIDVNVNPPARRIDPKVPAFPPAVEATAQKLQEIIDGAGERATLAYSALSRLCVLWTAPTPPKVAAEYSLDTKELTLSPNNGTIINELVMLMFELFPHPGDLPDEDVRL